MKKKPSYTGNVRPKFVKKNKKKNDLKLILYLLPTIRVWVLFVDICSLWTKRNFPAILSRRLAVTKTRIVVKMPFSTLNFLASMPTLKAHKMPIFDFRLTLLCYSIVQIPQMKTVSGLQLFCIFKQTTEA